MPRYELLAFDWDGTLFDSTACIVKSMQAAARELGLAEPSVERARHVIGLGLEPALLSAMPDLPRTRYRELAEAYRRHYFSTAHEVTLFEGVPELLHLLAARPFLDDSDPDRFFEAIARPRRPLHHTVTERLGIDAHTLLNGEAIDDVLERFRTFLGDGRLVCWGAFPRDLLAQAGDSRRGFVDVRAVTSRVLGAPAGGIEAAAASLGVVSAAGPTRGASMLAAVCAIVRALPERVGADGI